MEFWIVLILVLLAFYLGARTIAMMVLNMFKGLLGFIGKIFKL